MFINCAFVLQKEMCQGYRSFVSSICIKLHDFSKVPMNIFSIIENVALTVTFDNESRKGENLQKEILSV